MSHNHSSSSAPDYSRDTAGVKLWSVYVSEAEKYDKVLVDSWKSDMEGLLIFAGLFSAILTAFLIESYKTLTPDSGDDMKALLTQISTQLSGMANGSSVDLPAPESFVPATSSLVCNLLWFTSLGLSLSCALIGTLVEQWARDFKYKTEMRSAPVIRARIFSYLYYGLKRFNMHAVVEIIPFLLHASLILFFAGLVAFLVPVNKAVMIVVIILLGIMVTAYTTFTVFPLFSRQSPYQTPLSAGLWRATQLAHTIWRSASRQSTLNSDSMVDAMIGAAIKHSNEREDRDSRALSWTLRSLSDDVELEPFLEGIVDALATTKYNGTSYDEHIRCLLESQELRLFQRVHQLLHRCESSTLLEEKQTRRQLIAFKCLWAMATIPREGTAIGWGGTQYKVPSRENPFISPRRRRNPFDFMPLPFDNSFSFALFSGARGSTPLPAVVYAHQLSAHAVSRLNVLLTAMRTVNNALISVNHLKLRSSREVIPPPLTDNNSHLVQVPLDILEPLRALTDSPLWNDPRLPKLGEYSPEWKRMADISPLKDCITKNLPTHSSGRSLWFAECLASLESVHASLIHMGHEHFLDFMVHAARLGCPPYQFDKTASLVLGGSVQSTEVSPTIAAIYSDACNTVLVHQGRELASYQPHVDSILATLLKRLSEIQTISPDSNVSLPSNLSHYLSKPCFDRFKSAIFAESEKWWLCSCLTRELAADHAHVGIEPAEQILKAMWEVAAGMGTDHRRRLTCPVPVSPHTPDHPSRCMLEALRTSKIIDHPKTISIIALVQNAILNDSSPRPQHREFDAIKKVPAYPTLAKEDPSKDIEEELTLTILDLRVAVLAKFMNQASILHSPPYKINETMSTIMLFEPYPPGVSPPQQLDFAKSWKAALERDSLGEFNAAMVETVASCPLLQMYWDQSTTRFRWLDNPDAARVFVEGVAIAERREDITPMSRTRLVAIRESLTPVVDAQERQVEGGTAGAAIVTGGIVSRN
ncbi:hypothetical protein R3P38DRAFT_3277568 [Favolaschia claudopus]|uniref:DUF6535 domain-containing protein n=1 Tax=Favolaschia claudopus TaxID=2862362 RepID=A0AAW0ALD0_9AGAR